MAQGELIIDDELLDKIDKMSGAFDKATGEATLTNQSINKIAKGLQLLGDSSEEGIKAALKHFKSLKDELTAIKQVREKLGEGFELSIDLTNALDVADKLYYTLKKIAKENGIRTESITKENTRSFAKSARNTSKKAKTIDERKSAIKEMEEIQKHLKPTESWYKKINAEIYRQKTALQEIVNLTKNQQKAVKEEEEEVLRQIKEKEKAFEANQRKQQQWNKKQEQKKLQQEYEFNTSTSGALLFSQNAKTAGEYEQSIKYLNVARENLDKTDLNYAKNLRRLNDEIERHKRNLTEAKKSTADLEQERQKAEEKKREEYRGTYNGALDFSRNAKSIKEYEEAIKYLNVALKNADQTSHDFLVTREKLTTEIARNKEKIRISQMTYEEISKENEARRDAIDKQKVSDVLKDTKGAETIKEHGEALTKLRKTEKELYNTSEKLTEAKQRHIDAIKKQAEAERKLKEEQKNQSFTGSLEFSQNAKSINDRVQAIKNLQAARNKLSISDKHYKRHVKELNKEIVAQQNELKRLQVETQKSTNLMAGLAQKLKAVFGVQAITNYIKKMVDVRAEFEIEQKSLEVLLQSREEANKLWQQTTELALKSPFQIKQLITYTKQLAAYRIETDKLHDTTKRLADVSAGLGVDMHRLILAYGQVRAAEYLRGTELRQFTEAGIPMLDELAKRFSALEGVAVSTAEVFERISNRQVLFADVDAVIKGMTDMGGIFYNMQEEQSKTIQGMRSNLKDEIDLMFNEIGESTEGVIKNAIDLMRGVVKNWEFFANQLKIIIPVLGSVKLAQLATNLAIKQGGTTTLLFSKHLTKFRRELSARFVKDMSIATLKTQGFSTATAILAKGLSRVQLALKGAAMALKSFLPALAITAVVEFIFWLTSLNDKAEELQKTFNNIDLDISKTLSENIGLYIEQARVINKVTSSEKDRQEALTKMKTALSEILPDEMLELKYIQNKKGAYEEVTEAMREYYAIKAKEQKRSEVETQYGSEINDQMSDLISDFEDVVNQISNKDAKERITAFYEKVIQEVTQDVKDGKVGASSMELRDAIRRKLQEATELDSATFNNAWYEMDKGVEAAGVTKNIDDLSKALIYYKNALGSVVKHTAKNWTEYSVQLSQANENTTKAREALEEIAGLAQDVANGKYTWKQLEQDKKDIISKVPKEYTQWITTWFKKLEELSNQGSFAFSTNLYDVLDDAMLDLSKKLPNGNGFKALAETLAGFYDNNKLTDSSENIKNVIDKYAEVPNRFTTYLKDGQLNIKDVSKAIKSDIDEVKSAMTSLENADDLINIENFPELNKVLPLLFDKSKAKEIDRDLLKQYAEDYINDLTNIYTKLGNVETEKKTGGSKKDLVMERLKQRLDLIKRYASEFEKVGKNADFNEVVKRLGLAFGEEASLLGQSLEWTDEDTKNIDNLVKRLYEELLKEYTATKYQKEILKNKSPLEAELQIKVDEKNNQQVVDRIENLLSGYELGVEFEGKGIPKELAQSLFGTDEIQLDITLPDIRSEIQTQMDEIASAGGMNTELYKELERLLKQVDKEETKILQDRVAKYAKYSQKAMGEYTKIHTEYLRQLREIEESALSLPESEREKYKQNAIKGITKERDEALSKQEWEDFTGSDYYIQMFEDLDKTSDVAINAMITRLKDLRENLKDLPADQLKAIIDAQEKLKAEQRSRKSSFANLFSTIDERKNAPYADLSNEELDRKQQESLIKQKAKLEEIRALEERIANEKEGSIFREQAEWELEVQKEILSEEEKITSELERQKKLRKQQNEDLAKTLEDVSQIGNGLISVTNTLGEAFGADSDVMNAISEIGGGILDMGSGVARIMSGDIIGGVIQTAQGLADTIAGIAGASDASREKAIQQNIKDIEELTREYEELSEAIEKSNSLIELQTNYNSALANINKQIAEYEDNIKQENAKSNIDEDKITEWEQNILDLRQQAADLKDQIIADLGGVDDVHSFAQGFVDAWISAFQETGDGLSGLEEHFEEFYQNLMKEQVIKLAIQGQAAELAEVINKALGDDFTLTEDERQNIENKKEEILKEMDATMGIYKDFFGDTSAELSGLQKGIQGITESQADILASYLNSIRMFVSNLNTNSDQITKILKGQSDTNPILNQLSIIARQTQSINELIDIVTDRNSRAVRVALLNS